MLTNVLVGGESGDLGQIIAQMFPGAGARMGQLIQDAIASGRFQQGIGQMLNILGMHG